MFPVLFDANFRDKQLANVSAHWLKPSEPSGPSAMNVYAFDDGFDGIIDEFDEYFYMSKLDIKIVSNVI